MNTRDEIYRAIREHLEAVHAAQDPEADRELFTMYLRVAKAPSRQGISVEEVSSKTELRACLKHAFH